MSNDSIISDIAATLGIPPAGVSRRLMFAKTSALDTVWHVVDWVLNDADGTLVALHGGAIKPVVQADSILQMSLKETGELLLCAGCVEEFRIAADVIAKNPRTAFVRRGGKTGRKLE